MKTLTTLLLLTIGSASYSQIYWNDNFEAARKIAMAEQKFILMDFWATWCRPCVTMEHELWSKPEMAEIAGNFVALKVNVDNNKDLAVQYGATSIPKVVLIDPAGNVIWDQMGYATPDPYLNILENIPLNLVSDEVMKNEFDKNGNSESWKEIASSYQNLGKMNNSSRLTQCFLNMSDKYYHKIEKKGESKDLALDAQLNLILNDAYRGRSKSALKQIEKLENEHSELGNYILAYCYKCLGESDKAKEYKELVSDPKLLAQLEQ